jgi:NtrC-family two-component system response regulator AlgB
MSTAPGSAAPSLSVLLIDDEKNILTALAVCLEDLSCQVTKAPSRDSARGAIGRQSYDLVFLDMRLGDSNGLDLLPEILSESPTATVIVITAHASFDSAVEAIKRGAKDYLPKPFSPAQIEHIVQRVREERSLRSRVTELEARLGEFEPETDLETQSPKMKAALEMARRAAESDAAVLLRGESGTGKGVLARAIHHLSRRHPLPFGVVNCPTLSEELLSSELFGHAKGAFTGAVTDQPGRVEAAHGGTLFLDELGELSPSLQAKLLRFLQEKRYERVGETRTREADVRVIAATNRNLEEEIKKGRFREDLYYRLNVLEITLPPLRERREDLLRLAHRLLALLGRATRRSAPELSKAAEEALLGYSWPGNLRELRNALERALILWPAQIIEPQALPERIASRPPLGPQLGGDFTLDDIEREHLERVVSRAKSLEEAARILGIDESTLYRKRKRLGQ